MLQSAGAEAPPYLCTVQRWPDYRAKKGREDGHVQPFPWACGCGLAREHSGLLGTEDLKVADQFVTPGQWIGGIWPESREEIRHAGSHWGLLEPRGLA